MSPMQKVYFAALQAVVITVFCFSGTQLFASDCNSENRQTPISKAFRACEAAKTATTVADATTQMEILSRNGFCRLLNPTNNSTNVLNEICRDPAGYACARNQGKVFSSNCELQLLETADAAQLPHYVEAVCSARTVLAPFFDSKRSECAANLSPEECVSFLVATYPSAVAAITREQVYTEARISRVQTAFARVKSKAVQMVTDSTLIPVASKNQILRLIQETNLDLPLDGENASDCTVPGPEGPDTGVYNDGGGKIIFCIGAMAQLDQMNDYDLLHLLGHELSHSFDPCALELIEPAAVNSLTAYPGVIQCLRGGTGPDGCTNAVIHCNVSRGIEESCADQPSKSECIAERRSKPSCPAGPDDPTYNILNLAEYRKGRDPVSQIREGFSDYFGAEIVGRLASEDQRLGRLTLANRINGLLTLASDNVRLHGTCLQENTNDPHPVGYLRMNRIIMGSKSYRESLCGEGQAAPATNGAGVTCPSF